jgi:HPt (histidine-containing phosphotransfer) domain-containing protein
MEAQEIIDLAAYSQLKDLMGADFMLELIDTYCPETEDLIDKLQAALAAQDAAAFGRLAHSIKSSSASMGALALAGQARELEMMGKACDLSGAGHKLELLAASYAQVVRRLEELRNEP